MLYRGFVGGIASGKSFCGAYDLIRRSKPGRLYLVLAPTYPMLSDSTMRSFIGVATQLGLLDPTHVKKSPPPSAKLLTGAEILFRSADDPQRLRGPNLSGIWLDEASLMAEDAFNIAIGRLREAGEQGWLSATFTPKGRRHWTYNTFAAGRPDTAIFHARTRDNPFLHGHFEQTVRQQYTSTMAAQELGGEFVEMAGTMLVRAWFPIIEAAPADLKLVRAWDLAGTEKQSKSDERKGKASDPDWTVGVLMGKSKDNRYYILDVRRVQATPLRVEELIRQTAELDGKSVAIWMEQEPGSSGVAVIDHYTRHVLNGWNFHPDKPSGEKAVRAQPFAAQAEAGNVLLVRAAWNNELLDEIEMFPAGRHDDQVDAAALAFNKLAMGPYRRLWAG